MLTNATRIELLEAARKEHDAALARLNSMPKWNKAKEKAANDVEFWGNKTAFLANVKLDS